MSDDKKAHEYDVNGLRVGGGETPMSMVKAVHHFPWRMSHEVMEWMTTLPEPQDELFRKAVREAYEAGKKASSYGDRDA